VGDSCVKCQEAGRRRVDGCVFKQCSRDWQLVSTNKGMEKCSNTVCVLWRVGSGSKKNFELSKVLMHLVAQGDSVVRPVNISSFNEMDDTAVEHVQNGKGGFLRIVPPLC